MNDIERRDAMREIFLAAIREFSEDYWAATWYSGIENKLRADGGRWLVIAHACDGWPIGCNAEGGWAPLTLYELAQVTPWSEGPGPVRLCCGQRHYGELCPDGWAMCCLCFERVPVADLADDGDGKVDVCKSCHAAERRP